MARCIFRPQAKNGSDGRNGTTTAFAGCAEPAFRRASIRTPRPATRPMSDPENQPPAALAAPTGSVLLPCPFCGGPSKLLAASALWSAGCAACGIETTGLISAQEAVESWNQRREWDHKRIGDDMRQARQSAGLSGRQLAALLRCSPTYVSDLELGRRRWTAAKLRWFMLALSRNTDFSGVALSGGSNISGTTTAAKKS